MRARIILNTQMGIAQAASNGVGIGILPAYVAQNFDLVRVLPALQGPTIPLHFVYPSEMRRSKRVAALRAFIEDELRVENK